MALYLVKHKDHSFSPSTESKNSLSYTSTPIFHGVVLNKA